MTRWWNYHFNRPLLRYETRYSVPSYDSYIIANLSSLAFQVPAHLCVHMGGRSEGGGRRGSSELQASPGLLPHELRIVKAQAKVVDEGESEAG